MDSPQKSSVEIIFKDSGEYIVVKYMTTKIGIMLSTLHF